MLILLVGKFDFDVEDLLCEVVGIKCDELVFYDVFVYLIQFLVVIGFYGEFLVSQCMDNLFLVYFLVVVFVDVKLISDVVVMVCFDYEEVGLVIRLGVCGLFFEDVLVCIVEGFGMMGVVYWVMIVKFLCVFLDVGYGVYFNYVEKFDLVNYLLFNEGLLFKINVYQCYVIDGVGGVLWQWVCVVVGVLIQNFVLNNLVLCGLMIGLLMVMRFGMLMVDVGVLLMLMYFICEFVGMVDLMYLFKVLGVYWVGV